MSGRSEPDNVVLRDEAHFRANAIDFVPNATVVALDPAQKSLRLAAGETWNYDKLLIATGAAPALPPVPGLPEVPYHVLRSMQDALGLREAMQHAKSAIVLGAGLIGMHAAENMAKAGIEVCVVEMQPHALSGYFEPRASAIIERTFSRNGIRMLMDRTLHRVERRGEPVPGHAQRRHHHRGRPAAGLHRGQAQYRLPRRLRASRPRPASWSTTACAPARPMSGPPATWRRRAASGAARW